MATQTVTLPRPPSRSARCRIDQILLVAGKVLITGTCSADLVLDRISVAVPGGGEPVVILAPSFVRNRLARAEKAARGEAEDSGQGFILAVPLDEALPMQPLETELIWSVMASRHAAATVHCRARSLGSLGEPVDPELAAILDLAGQCGSLDAAVAKAILGLKAHANAPQLLSDMDSVSRISNTIVFDGWLANARRRRIVVLSDDAVTAASNLDLLFTARPDVSNHLSSVQARVLSDYHGVVGVLPLVSRSTAKLWLVSLDEDRIERVHAAVLNAARSDAAVIERMITLCTGNGLPDPGLAERLLLPLLRPPKIAVDYDRQVISDPGAVVELSIIVPLYKDWSFLRSLTTMQLNCAANIEWVFVCDDPGMHREVQRYLRNRSDFLQNRTVLVTNHGNYGYSRANNIGAEAASGEFLLFMNSDIWMEDPAPLETALAAIEDGSFGIIGFRLLYEDDTLQHDGMSFHRSGYFNDLFVSEHLGKGLPARLEIRASPSRCRRSRARCCSVRGAHSRRRAALMTASSRVISRMAIFA